MNRSDLYLKTWLQEWKEKATPVRDPRTKWGDGTAAQYKSIHQKVARYDLNMGEWPINTLRPTAIKGGFHEIQWFYQKQSSWIKDLDESIHGWWKDFVTAGTKWKINDSRNIGATYGDTVNRYNLIDNLLKGLLENPFGRRHQIDLWQYEQMNDDPRALPPCVFLNMWSVSDRPIPKGKEYIEKIVNGKRSVHTKIRYLNLTLVQRSMDGLMTFSINPTQYAIMALMIVSHLNYHSNYYYEVGELLHIVNDFHIYDRHEKFIDEILERETSGKQPRIELNVFKDFFDITWEDFKVIDYDKPAPLSGKLEIAI